MLAALDALIENGTGGRQVLVLRQVCGLFLRVGFSGEGDTSTLFDDLMATLAMDLDEAALPVLAPELQRLPGLLPGFTATVMSRFHELGHRRDEVGLAETPEAGPNDAVDEPPPAIAIDLVIAPLAPESTAAAGADPAAEPALQPGYRHTEHVPVSQPAPLDRRAVPRDLVADALDPLTLARRASPAQLREIARLPQLPVGLTGVIMTRGDVDAIAVALANPGAVFTRSSLLAVAEMAAGDQRLKHGLLSRADLPECVVQRLLPVIGRDARARVVMSGSRGDIQAARAALAASQQALSQAHARGESVQTLDALRRDMADNRKSADEVMACLAGALRLPETAALAVAELGVELVTAHAMLVARLDQPAGILVRALGGHEQSVEDVLGMRRVLGLQAQRDLHGPAQICAQWTREEARVMITLIGRDLAAASDTPLEASTPILALAG